ncbi:hypothetical protein CHLRE_09g392245v5 [Chlamydomonas reinhardtii]|uniref:Dolichol-phosphate mannosyltransferase subunit 3 n=1 Tax=Chlamydomonas reinhardtii TaxID=3055 RepID=A8J062_CHLRE|nr:uncharacterized protein CHLRE_09g392245v5 [Chlamydomonas reinhardtii]PNW78851.1 hypothetical protein CHLRE_09g392245v5 [Chlamydomonas reinhardtii]|eukprot:XP_001694739.1 predicted protein [Chlamydomonas reinhardtii]
MKRFHYIVAAAAFALVAWLAACAVLPPGLPKVSAFTAPVWMAFLLAGYLLARLVYGVLTFKSYPSAIADLQREVQEARLGLQAMGVSTG